MKYLLIVALSLFMGLFLPVHAQDSTAQRTPEYLGEQALRAFKTQDLALFKSLLLTETSYELMLNQITASDSVKTKYRSFGLGAIKHLQGQAESNVEEVNAQANLLGIDWTKASLITVKRIPRGKQDIERADIVVWAQSEEKKFSVVLANSHKGDRWYIMGKVKLIEGHK